MHAPEPGVESERNCIRNGATLGVSSLEVGVGRLGVGDNPSDEDRVDACEFEEPERRRTLTEVGKPVGEMSNDDDVDSASDMKPGNVSRIRLRLRFSFRSECLRRLPADSSMTWLRI